MTQWSEAHLQHFELLGYIGSTVIAVFASTIKSRKSKVGQGVKDCADRPHDIELYDTAPEYPFFMEGSGGVQFLEVS
jgi:hypothetical protein